MDASPSSRSTGPATRCSGPATASTSAGWFVGGLLSDRQAYRYLPKSVVYLPDEAALLGQIADAGFNDVAKRRLSGGIAQLLTATRA